MTVKKNILVIASDPEVKGFLEAELRREGFRADIVENGKAAEKAMHAHRPHLVLVDMAIPGAEGAIRLFRTDSRTPVIALVANDHDGEKVRAFDAGADDYVTKPLFEPSGLRARMGAALRQSAKAEAQEMLFRTQDLTVDIWRRRVTLHGRDVRLTPLEFDLLALLVRRAGQVVTQAEMLKEIWGKDPERHSHYLRIYIQRLRQKLRDDPFQPRYIITEAKIGYRLNDGSPG